MGVVLLTAIGVLFVFGSFSIVMSIFFEKEQTYDVFPSLPKKEITGEEITGEEILEEDFFIADDLLDDEEAP